MTLMFLMCLCHVHKNVCSVLFCTKISAHFCMQCTVHYVTIYYKYCLFVFIVVFLCSELAMDPSEKFLVSSRFWVQRVLVPILVLIGAGGNIVTVMVLTR